MLHHRLPDGSQMPKKELVPTHLLRALNLQRLDELPGKAWRLLSDGSFSGETDEEIDEFLSSGGEPSNGCAALLELYDRSKGTLRDIRDSKSQVASSAACCSFTCEAHAATDALQLALDTLHHVDYTGRTVPLDTNLSDDGKPLPLVLLVDSLSILLMLAKGCNAQTHEFGSKLWHLLLQIAQHRQIFCVFVYSHVGLGQQDIIDELADAAREADSASVEQHPLWQVDVVRAQVRPDLKAIAAELDDAHNTRDSYRSLFRDSKRFPLLTLPRAQHETITRLRLGCDARVGGFFHTKGNRANVCPLPGCNCVIDRDGDFLNEAQMEEQQTQRALVKSQRPESSDDKLDLGKEAVVEHGVHHFFRCFSGAVVAARKAAGLPANCTGAVLWNPLCYDAVLKYHAWFTEARLAISSGGSVELNGTTIRGIGAARIWPNGVDLVRGWSRRSAKKKQQQQQ